jgi:hypothetical protein
MPYLGTPPQSGFITSDSEKITGQTTNYVNLSNAISSLDDVQVHVNYVIQDPSTLTLNSTAQIGLGDTLVSSDVVLITYLGKSVATQSPPVGGVTNDMLAGSIANSKLANSSITLNGSAVSLGGSATVSGGLVYLGGINSSNYSVNKLALQQVFSDDYRRYKVMGKFQGTGAGAYIEFRWLNSSNSEMTSSYYVIAGGTKSNSASISAEEWFNWNTSGARLFEDTATGSHIHSFTMELFPNQNENVNYPSAIFHTQGWDHNNGGNRQRVIEGAIYNEFTTSIAGGGIQLESSSGLFGTVNMSIWGYKDS